MKELSKYLYAIVGAICLGIGALVYNNNINFKERNNELNLGDTSGIGEAASAYVVKFHGVNNVDLKGLKKSITITYKNNSYVAESDKLRLEKNTRYTVSFNYSTKGKDRQFNVDIYPDSLNIQKTFTATNKTQHVNWVFSSNNANIENCSLRFFDDIKGTNDKDIVISNIRLYSASLDMNSIMTLSLDGNKKLGDLPLLSRYGYKFLGWYNEKIGGTQITKDTILTGNMDLYPHWEAISVQSIKLNRTSATILKGKTMSLNVKLEPTEVENNTISWTSSDSKVASVDSKGVVTGNKVGTAVITATSYNGKKAQCTVTISKLTNTITLAEKKEYTIGYNKTKNQVKDFPAPSKAIGKVTYKIESQKNANGQAVSGFSLPSPTQAKIQMAAKTPAGKYTVVVVASASGNDDYKVGSKKISLIITVKYANSMTIAEKQKVSYTYNANSYKDAAFKEAQKAQGSVTYTIVSQKNSAGKAVTSFSLPANNSAKLRMAKGTNTGTYTIVLIAKAAGNATYYSKTKEIKITAKVGSAKNPMKVTTPQNFSVEKLSTIQTITFKGASNAIGTVNYKIASQTKDGKAVKVFSMEKSTEPKLKLEKNTPKGTYLVKVNATAPAANNGNYSSVSSVIEIKVIVVEKEANQIKVTTPQIWKTTYSAAKDQTKSFTPAAVSNNGADGKVTYHIYSKYNGTVMNNATIMKYFKIELATSPTIKMLSNTPAGNYTVKITASASGSSTRKAASKHITMNVTVGQIENTMTVKSQTINQVYSTTDKTFTFTGAKSAQGTVTYTIPTDKNSATIRNYFKIGTPSANKISMKGKTPVGTYKVVVYATATGNINYKKATKSMTLTIVVKNANPITIVASQNMSLTSSTSAQTKAFTAATKNQGPVTYTVPKDKNNATVLKYFSIPENIKTAAKIQMAANTPAGTYNVVVRATAAGNATYASGYKDTTLKVTVASGLIKGTASVYLNSSSLKDSEGYAIGQSVTLDTLKDVSIDKTTWNNILKDPDISWKNSNESVLVSLNPGLYLLYETAAGKTTKLIGTKNGHNYVELDVTIKRGNHKITFMNGSSVATTITKTFGSELGTLPSITKRGYKSSWVDGYGAAIDEHTRVGGDKTYYVKWIYDVADDAKYDSYSTVARYNSATLDYRIISLNKKYREDIVLVWVADPMAQLNNALASPSNAVGAKAGEAILNQEISTYKLQNKGLVAVNASFYEPTGDPSGSPKGIIFSHGKLIKTYEGSAMVALNYKLDLVEYSGNNGEEILSRMKKDGVENSFVISSRTAIDGSNKYSNRTQICQIDVNNYAILSSDNSTVQGGGKTLASIVNCKKDSYGEVVFNLDGSASSKLIYKANTSALTKRDNQGRIITDMLYFVEQ